ncbi:hypothetical protein BASA50_002960 [Batrachochytrium salamandrivorans]|uniref:Transcriptional coactivator p15 (PC4) C-terminal domain-containing protein n=1 Tax=Batrachochytrium salamandrivorans TaxID=1357716 RepID=A0ABQ8FK22_9FUNG|nr:hypothetical protein BASA60_006724 [Batrachochytrium salamandrivorans]KAH6587529.1 hypothetical protein BASA61_006255 [Batrachochytrium salamandrivorans]KAH6599618.1 hypothetical protein BASA50_002960 [Batrachochytrium salamandrivorans]KAH9268024.1 hypothetical protein BASA84_000492 [Batrachochytrium salamandrivorans]KAH9276943.1 hypothetical protein BASA83_000457 [Batrachochytrium salamandrivorans]
MPPKRQITHDDPPADATVKAENRDHGADTTTIGDAATTNETTASTASSRAKKTKTAAAKSTAKDPNAGSSTINSKGELTLNVCPKKKLTVSKWNDMVLVGIREYYTADGEEKPSKKGISFSPEAWRVIRDNADLIDTAIGKLG